MARLIFMLALSGNLLIAGFPTASIAASPTSQIEKAIKRCAPQGEGPQKLGCGVLAHLDGDSEILASKQLEAVQVGQDRTEVFAGAAGQITLITRILAVPSLNPEQPGQCRLAASEVQIAGVGEAPLGAQTFCQSTGGGWVGS